MALKVLAFDLGLTTGWAYLMPPAFRKDAPIEEHWGEFSGEDFETAYIELSVYWGEPTHIVIEVPIVVRGQLGDQIQGILYAMTHALEPHTNVCRVQPSEWKSHPMGQGLVPRGLSPHERDALRMARWFYHVKLKGGTNL